MNQHTCLSANNNNGELSAFHSDLRRTSSFTRGFDKALAPINYNLVRHLTLVVLLDAEDFLFSEDNDFTSICRLEILLNLESRAPDDK